MRAEQDSMCGAGVPPSHAARAAGVVPPARPTPRPDVLAVPLHDELILHDERSGQTYVLNSTGAQAWKLCDGARSTAMIARAIASQYRIGEDSAREDVQALIDGLKCAHLLDYR